MEDKKNNAGIKIVNLQRQQDKKIQGQAPITFTLPFYFQSHS